MSCMSNAVVSAPSARTNKNGTAAYTRALAIGCLLAMTACFSTKEPTPSPNAIRIGTVLPFSGPRAASGVPLEAALRMAIDDVNAAGGLGGRPLWLDIADSHSDDDLGTANALNLIENRGIPYFIGTEEPKITYQITSAVKAHGMVQVLPALTSAQFHDPSATAAWFRISPSVSYLACALAKRVMAEGLSKVSVVVDADDYSGNFAVKFAAAIRAKGYAPLPSLLMDPQSSSYAEMFLTLRNLRPDAVVLMTSPSLAANFLQEWAVRDRPLKIYLGPTLKNPELLRNVPAGILEGIVGVSSDLGEQAPAFATTLEERSTALAVAESHFYFDAVALLSLAVAEGIAQTGSIPSPAAIKAHMLNVTSPGGSVVSFDRMDEGLALLAAGEKITYLGAAGSYVLNALGDSTLSRGSIWQIAGNEFLTIGSEQCDPKDLNDLDKP